MNPMLKRLVDERQERAAFIEGMTTDAQAQKRDLLSNELELITRAQSRIGELDTQLDVLGKDIQLSAESAERLARIGQGVNGGGPADPSAVDYKTAGAYLRDYLGSLIGEGEFKVQSEDRLRRYHRAAAHITTAQFAGVFPQPIVGPLISFINTSRPLVSALGVIPIPAGPSFRRPRLVDPNIATGVGVQANQKDELVSQPFTIQSDNVDLSTRGGYVNVARQVLDWGVASMDAIVNQLAGRYSYSTERLLVSEIGLSTSKVPLAAGADAATTIKAIYDAAALVYEKTQQLPTILAAGPLGWARLGALSDLDGRQIFPFLAPANAAGQSSATSFEGNPVGLRMVVTPAITDDTYWVLNQYAAEFYEQVIGQLSVVEPSVLGIQVAYAGYTGVYRPAPDGAVHVAP